MGSIFVVVIGYVINGFKDGGDGDGVFLCLGILFSFFCGDRLDVRFVVLNLVRIRFDCGVCFFVVCFG